MSGGNTGGWPLPEDEAAGPEAAAPGPPARWSCSRNALSWLRKAALAQGTLPQLGQLAPTLSVNSVWHHVQSGIAIGGASPRALIGSINSATCSRVMGPRRNDSAQRVWNSNGA